MSAHAVVIVPIGGSFDDADEAARRASERAVSIGSRSDERGAAHWGGHQVRPYGNDSIVRMPNHYSS